MATMPAIAAAIAAASTLRLTNLMETPLDVDVWRRFALLLARVVSALLPRRRRFVSKDGEGAGATLVRARPVGRAPPPAPAITRRDDRQTTTHPAREVV